MSRALRGEHNREILAAILGLSDRDVTDLERKKIV
jgi:hypothetical protein